jgi:peptidoglycan/xylan/chitin deacetylase (PgdA/CDA1 family)
MESLLRRLKSSSWTAAVMHGIGTPMVIGLAYHGTTMDRHTGVANTWGRYIDSTTLGQQLAFISRNYRVIRLSELVRSLENRRELPRKAVFLTFDDGYSGNYHVAYPLLKEFGLSATFFVPTYYVESGLPSPFDILDAAIKYTKRTSVEIPQNSGTEVMRLESDKLKYESAWRLHSIYKEIPFERQAHFLEDVVHGLGFSSPDTVPLLGSYVLPMTWEQLREIAAGGMEIGSHTHRHVILARVGNELVEEELYVSKELLEKNLDQPCTLFCYPNGHYPEDGNKVTNHLVRKAGYSCATYMHKGTINRWTDRYFLTRNAIGLYTEMIELEISLAISGPRVKSLVGKDPSPFARSLRNARKVGAGVDPR